MKTEGNHVEMTKETLKECLGMIDLTSLNASDTHSGITALVGKVNGFQAAYPGLPLPASICVYPNFSSTVRKALKVKDVDITVVAGCFPASQSYIEVKELECRMAVENGADEVDIVLALNSFLDGDYGYCKSEIERIRQAIGRARLKVILETGILGTEDAIRRASFLAMEAGADFIKTSTGKTEPAATPAAAEIMCKCIREYYERAGRKVGFKPAGGISTAEDAATYYSIVGDILGKEWLNPSLMRFGASRLANSIVSALEGETVIYF